LDSDSGAILVRGQRGTAIYGKKKKRKADDCGGKERGMGLSPEIRKEDESRPPRGRSDCGT